MRFISPLENVLLVNLSLQRRWNIFPSGRLIGDLKWGGGGVGGRLKGLFS